MIASRQDLNYLAFQSLDFERTWWRLLQKRVVRTKLDIYVFIIFNWFSWNLLLNHCLKIYKMFPDYEKNISKLNNLAISLALTRNILAIYKWNNSCKVSNIRIKSEMCKWSSPHDEHQSFGPRPVELRSDQ